MRVDLTVVPGLLLLAAELAALAAVGYVIVRAVLRQDDERMALAQGLVVGPALWGVITNFVLYVVPGLAGAAVGWGVMLAIGAVVAWRARGRICPRARTAAGLAVAFLALFWVALATRQLLTIQDWPIQLGLASSIRAGAFPPELPWHPATPVRYHHGPSLLVGLLAPPVGPDQAFVSELLDAYGWTSFILVAVAAIVRRGSWLALPLVAPLLLTHGAWTVIWVGNGLLEIPLPAGLPAAGLRDSLADIYWPSVAFPPNATPWGQALADIWKPAFTLGYALAFVVVERAAHADRRSWPAAVTLAGLVGFIGVLAATFAPVVLAVWAGLEALHLARSWRDRPALARRLRQPRDWMRLAVTPGLLGGAMVRSGGGLALAVLLLLGGGSVFTGLLDGGAASGLSLSRSLDPGDWRLLGTFDRWPGGVALLGVGPVVVAGVAALLARRDRVVLALAAGSGLLALAWLALYHEPAPKDLDRVAGHARNLALVALLLALSTRLTGLGLRWRAAAAALFVGLIVWPTVVGPVRNVGLALGSGIQIANADGMDEEPLASDGPESARRFQLPAMSERLAARIRDHTSGEARVLATTPPYANVFLATGRPNAAGLAEQIHLNYVAGPEYLDAVNYLEPRAFRRLGLDYVHATDAWRADLPDRAVRWLDNPRFFEPLARDGGETLYRVRPAFPQLDAAPHPASFEALRALPSSPTLYLHQQTSWWSRIRIASALPDAQLMGALNLAGLHLRTPLRPVESLGVNVPDLVVLPAAVDPWMFPAGWRPIWRNEDAVVYASPSAAPPVMALPDIEPAPVSVRVTDARLNQGRLTFTATYSEHAPERWTSQDWVLVPLLESPLGIPAGFVRHERGPVFAKWIDGLLSSGSAATTHTYRLDLATSALEVRNERGAFTPLPASGGDLGTGTWALVIRLRHEWQPNLWREAAFVPVVRMWVADDGEIAFEVYDNARRG
ncbi:MAG: hypothetical protein OXG33_09955 [Chloroflexi bacterium]|nr:hypothetical protein [Chloroflexota bacterium]